MSASTHMQIAGVHFSIHCEDADVLPDQWPCYRSFEASAEVPFDAVAVRLGLEVGGMPDVSSMDRLFDGEAWSLFRHGDQYCIALAPRGKDLPSPWIACMDSSFTQGVVYCDEVLVQDNDGVKGIINPILHRLDQLLVMYVLSGREGMVVHAAGAVFEEKAYLFAGRSGAGKSTIAKQLQEASSDGEFRILSDDRMVIRRIEGQLLAFGTPWAGDAQIGSNEGAPLDGLFFLRHGQENEAIPLSASECAERLIPLASVPWYDPELVTKVTTLCGEVAEAVPASDLFFRPTPEVGDFLESVLDRA